MYRQIHYRLYTQARQGAWMADHGARWQIRRNSGIVLRQTKNVTRRPIHSHHATQRQHHSTTDYLPLTEAHTITRARITPYALQTTPYALHLRYYLATLLRFIAYSIQHSALPITDRVYTDYSTTYIEYIILLMCRVVVHVWNSGRSDCGNPALCVSADWAGTLRRLMA
jgi:hypothetical protein